MEPSTIRLIASFGPCEVSGFEKAEDQNSIVAHLKL